MCYLHEFVLGCTECRNTGLLWNETYCKCDTGLLREQTDNLAIVLEEDEQEAENEAMHEDQADIDNKGASATESTWSIDCYDCLDTGVTGDASDELYCDCSIGAFKEARNERRLMLEIDELDIGQDHIEQSDESDDGMQRDIYYEDLEARLHEYDLTREAEADSNLSEFG